VNLFKKFGQAIFYAWASGVSYPLLRTVDEEEMYQLLAWQHWYRSVADINAAKAAANAALLAAVLEVLSSNGRPALFIGHDGNLDGLATLLSLQWDAPP